MKFKSVIQKKIAPLFAPYGFELVMPGGVNYILRNDTTKQQITFDSTRFSPGELRIMYWQGTRNKGVVFFTFSYFRNSFFPYQLDYTSQEAFDESLCIMSRKIIEIIFPYGNDLRENQVFVTKEMYEALADRTIDRANRFAARWDLHYEATDMKRIAEIQYGMQTTMDHRLEEFTANQEMIIDMAAYFGELYNIIRGNKGKWLWRDDLPNCRPYVPATFQFDVLHRTIDSWNFGKEVYNFGLEIFPI